MALDGDTVELESLVVADVGAVDQIEPGQVETEAETDSIDETGRAEQAARVLVGWLEKLFSVFSRGFRFDPDLKGDSSERLAPAIERRKLASAGPLAYAAEFDAILYGAELIGSGLRSVKSKKAEPEKPADDVVGPVVENDGQGFTLG